jgi:uncharacterized membrane protein YqjE
MGDGGSEQPPPRDLRSAAARLGASLLGLARTRLELASVEFSEERDRIQRQLALMLAALACLMFALFFAATWIIVYYWDSNRLAAIAIIAAVFAAAGAALLVVRSQAARSAPAPFAATVAEFESDSAAFRGRAHGDGAAPPLL